MKKCHSLKKLIAVAVASVTASGSFAQEDLFVEEILVTARKQTETLQDIPLSLTAINSEEIELQAIENTEDVIALTPGLTYTKGIGGNDVRPDIRGITPLSGRSNLALLVDGVDITSDAIIGTGAGQLVSLGLYDIERIEVVRGPQSALFGRNAFGGAINYITAKPSTDFEGSISGEVSSYDTFKTKLSLTGPINEKLLYRTIITHSEKDGQYDDEITGTEYGGEESQAVSLSLQFLPNDDLEILTRIDWSDQDTDLAAKGTIQANACVDQRTETKTSVVTKEEFGGNPITCAADTGRQVVGTLESTDDLFIAASDDNFEGTDNRVFQFTALVNYFLNEDYQLTSNTSYTKQKSVNDYDLDHLPNATLDGVGTSGTSDSGFDYGVISGQGPRGAFSFADSPETALNYHTDELSNRQVLFQDFRLSFDAAEDVRWLAGIEYYSERFEQKSFQRANNEIERGEKGSFEQSVSYIDPLAADNCELGFPFFFPCIVSSTVTFDSAMPIEKQRNTESYGIYGSYDWSYAEDWELSLSARFQVEKIEGELENVLATLVVPARPVAANGPGFVGTPEFLRFEEDFEAFNPRVVLTHYLTDSVMLFGSIAKGTKPGGVNGDIDVNENFFTYEPEEIISYELGWKTSWLDDRVIVNGAIFLNDNTNKQANNRDFSSKSGTPRSYIDNIGEAQSSGIELQVAGVISAGWTANLNYAYTETEVLDFINQNAAGIESANTFDDLGQTTREGLAQARADFQLQDPDIQQAGKELPYTPKHNLTINSTYEWMMSDNYDAFVRVDYRMQSERWLSTNNLAKLEDYGIWDLKFGIRSEVAEITAFVNNVEDDDTITSAVTFPNFTNSFSNQVVGYPADKRSAGIRAKYSF